MSVFIVSRKEDLSECTNLSGIVAECGYRLEFFCGGNTWSHHFQNAKSYKTDKGAEKCATGLGLTEFEIKEMEKDFSGKITRYKRK